MRIRSRSCLGRAPGTLYAVTEEVSTTPDQPVAILDGDGCCREAAHAGADDPQGKPASGLDVAKDCPVVVGVFPAGPDGSAG